MCHHARDEGITHHLRRKSSFSDLPFQPGSKNPGETWLIGPFVITCASLHSSRSLLFSGSKCVWVCMYADTQSLSSIFAILWSVCGNMNKLLHPDKQCWMEQWPFVLQVHTSYSTSIVIPPTTCCNGSGTATPNSPSLLGLFTVVWIYRIINIRYRFLWGISYNTVSGVYIWCIALSMSFTQFYLCSLQISLQYCLRVYKLITHLI